MLRFFTFIGIVVILASCSEDRSDIVFPEVTTSECVSISDNGAILSFSAAHINPSSIEQCGVEYWRINREADKYRQQVEGDISHLIWNVKLESNLVSGEEYIARSYVQTGEFLVFGNEVEFESQGGIAPEIIKVEPLLVNFGDTIGIRGRDFSSWEGLNSVQFNQTVTIPIEYSDTLLKVVVPELRTTENIQLTVTSAGKSVTSAEKISIEKPVFTSIQPNPALPGDIITIYGDKLDNIESVRIGAVSVYQVLSKSESKLTFKLGTGESKGVKDVSLKQVDRELEMANRLEVIYPTIESVYPDTAWVDSILTITGTNIDKFDYFELGDVGLTLLSQNDSIARLIVPRVFPSSPVTGRFFNNRIKSNDIVNLMLPEIREIIPSIAYGGDIITLKGERFFSEIYSSIGWIQSITATEIQLVLPNDLKAGSHTIDLHYRNDVSIGKVSFTVPKIEIVDFYPKTLRRGDTITVELNGLPENFAGFYAVAIGNRSEDLWEVSGNTIKARVPLGYDISGRQALSVFVAGQEATIPDAVTINEYWEKVDVGNFSPYYGTTFLDTNQDHYAFYMDYNAGAVLDKFDKQTEKWKYLSSLNVPEGTYLNLLNSFAIDDELYFLFSDQNEQNRNYKYSISTGEWTQFASINDNMVQSPMYTFAGQGRAYAGNGSGLLEYNKMNDSWVKRSDLPTNYAGTYVLCDFSSGSSGYLAFNRNIIDRVEYSELWKYDFDSDSWADLGASPNSVHGGGTAVVEGSKIYMGSRPYYWSKFFVEMDTETSQTRTMVPPPISSGDIFLFIEGEYFYFGFTGDGYGGCSMWKIRVSDFNQIYLD